MRQFDARLHYPIDVTSANSLETAEALQNLRGQLRLINRSIRLMEQVERIRKKRSELVSEKDLIACCLAANKINMRRFSTSPHNSSVKSCVPA